MTLVKTNDRVFPQRSKKGGLVQIVREQYVRDDIPCGCAACPRSGADGSGTTMCDLSQLTSTLPKEAPFYLVPDAEVRGNCIGEINLRNDGIMVC